MKLNMLKDEEWKDINEIVLFGYGRQGKRVLKSLKKEFNIIGIVENDLRKVGKEIDGIPIYYFGEVKEQLLQKYKIIVTTAEQYYKEIKEQLKEIGLIENINFIMYQTFIMEWYYKYKRKIYLLKTDVVITSLCSLKCKNCTLFMPYWKKKISFNIEQLKEDIDDYFRCVDYVLDMNIIGGEPFLYKKLDEILSWYGDKYRQRIGYLGIITNGTVIPDDKMLDVIKKYNIGVSISDYSRTVNYKSRVEQLCDVLQEEGIEYFRNDEIQWFDFGFPENKYCYEGDAARIHMENCNTICHCLNEGKIYYCATAWAAYKAGMYPKDSKGYIDLKEINENDLEDRKSILECCMGNFGGESLSFCKVCGGYGNDNGNKIKAALQLEEEFL